MPSKRPGEEPHTSWKHDGIREVIQLVALTIYGINRKNRTSYPFWYMDANAGDGEDRYGIKQQSDVDDRFKPLNRDGSPLVFLDVVSRYGIRYVAMLCERNKKHLENLERNIHSRYKLKMKSRRYLPYKEEVTDYEYNNESYAHLYRGDNHRAINEFAELIRYSGERKDMAMGLVFLDPNAISKESYPIYKLADFCKEFTRIDICLNVNISHMERCLGVEREGRVKFNLKWPKTLYETMGLFSKDWIVRRPVGGVGSYEFIMLVGRGKGGRIIKESRNMGFIPVECADGQQILEKIDERLENIINRKEE